MFFKINRGTQEIGGSCVEVWSSNTRIIVDMGMPLVDKNRKEFNFNKYKNLDTDDLITQNILPNIKGLYNKEEKPIDGLLISHPHLDHFGFINFVNERVKTYLGEATHKIIEISNIFTTSNYQIKNYEYFEKEKSFQIGDIKITPFWNDHSAFDSYSFLIQANGKSIFYSGDFRGHGRKEKVFKWFTNNAPQNVDYLLLEGTQIGRNTKISKTETDIENEFSKIFSEKDKINLVYSSGQNIDRLVSIFKACSKTNKIFVIDVYIAGLLKELSKFAKLPFPSNSFKNIKVMYPYYTCKKLKNSGKEKILFQFKKYKITKEEISQQRNNIVMMVRSSFQKDLKKTENIEGGNLIYSMWEGYLQKESTKKFIEYLKKRKFKIHKIHTSGHADIESLKRMVNSIKPKKIIPIHTFSANKYQSLFDFPVQFVNDDEEISL